MPHHPLMIRWFRRKRAMATPVDGRNPHYNPDVVRVDTLDIGADGSITRTTDEVPLDEWLHP